MRDVVAGVIKRDRCYLVSRRADSQSHGGYWEFPGGTRRRGESLPECLQRELREELGIDISVGSKLAEIPLQSSKGRRKLHFFSCEIVSGEPACREVAELLWLTKSELSRLKLLEADRTFVSDFLGA